MWVTVCLCLQNSFSYISGVWDLLSVCAVNENVWDSSTEIFAWLLISNHLRRRFVLYAMNSLGLCDKPAGHWQRTSKVSSGFKTGPV